MQDNLTPSSQAPSYAVASRSEFIWKCYAHVARMEFGEMLSLARALHWVGPYCIQEPYVSKYEQAIGLVGSLTGVVLAVWVGATGGQPIQGISLP